MSRTTTAPVLTSLLLILLLLLPRDSAAATEKQQQQQQQMKGCKSVDEVLLEKYVTVQKRSSSDNHDVRGNATAMPPLPSGEFNWLGLYLLLQDRAEQLCNNTLYTILNDRYSDRTYDREDNAATTAVPSSAVGSEDQQANNVTLNSTAQKESTWINASTSNLTYNNDERSGKFLSQEEEEEVNSTTSYYDSTSSILSGNFNQTFTMDANEASGNETLGRDNEDESYRNEAIHADSKEKFRRHKKQPLGKVGAIVTEFFEPEDEIVDVPRNDSIEIDEDSSVVDEHDKIVDDFFANENSEASNETVAEHDEMVDNFFANENDSFSVSDFVNSNSTETSSRENNSADNKFVDDFFANENEKFSLSDFVNSNSTETSSRENNSADDKFVDDFFANENEDLSENGIRGSGHSKKMLEESQNNNTASERDEFVDNFFASENENLTVNGIGSEEPSEDSKGTLLDDKANNNKTASSEFNSIKSQDDVSSSSSAELTPSMEHFFEEFSNEDENSTNWRELTSGIENSTISQELSPTKSSDEAVRPTSTEMPKATDFFNNSSSSSSENPLSKLENSTENLDSSELISPKEFLEVAISEEEKNATAAQLRAYSNETVATTTANGTEDRSTKYLDTGDRNKAGHTTSSDDDLFTETTTTTTATTAAAMTTTTSLDDWSSTIASIASHADEKVSQPAAAAVQRRRRNVLMTLEDDVARAASAGKLRAPEATSWLVNEKDDSSDDDDAWESSRSAGASSRNHPARIITGEMNKAEGVELRRQYRTFLLGLQQSRQTQFAEKKGQPPIPQVRHQPKWSNEILRDLLRPSQPSILLHQKE